MENRGLQLLSWQNVAAEVEKVNPQLAQVINSIEIPQNCKVIKASYNFGDHILDKGTLHLPYKGKIYPIGSKELPKEIVRELSYTNIPVGLPLNKIIEVYLDNDNFTIPFSISSPGDIFALWSILSADDSIYKQHAASWNMTAGSRSLHLLPKTSDARSFNRLKKELSLKNIKKPKNVLEQWNLFKAISDTQTSEDKWSIEVLFFSKEWFENKKLDSLRLYLHSMGWRETGFLRDSINFKFKLSHVLTDSNLKPNPYIVDTLHHLYAIRRSFYPGFFVASNEVAPIDYLQQAFTDLYRIPSAPVFLSANQFDKIKESQPAYYSLQIPTLMEFSPKSRMTSRVVDIVELHDILEKVEQNCLSREPDASFRAVDEWIFKTEHDFFHTNEIETNLALKSTQDIVKEDKTMLRQVNKYPSLAFSESASFLRGCVRVCKKDSVEPTL
ncbi:hypothetical protein LO80_06325 [Candidatus Francisella endociliophora]|uniref:Uncharacterized protein n=1 Tax=Candidatus Francisella endociliophora TaxID=653937 RepID=A0A097EPX0_9GAMM|nr:hypothetical protein [Francisella sp. FSC1006]AIT09615.1 hypothetical protein LO80_06325 [Francisella sp. FSC1006]